MMFEEKIFLSRSINIPSFIVWLPLHYYITKKSRQQFKYLENERSFRERSFRDEIKNVFHHFKRIFIQANKKEISKDESPFLIISCVYFQQLG